MIPIRRVVQLACLAAAIATGDVALAGDQSLTGAWRIVSFKVEPVGGEARDLYGANMVGMLLYDASGFMSAQATQLDLPKCGTTDRRKCPDKQARAAFDNYLGYWGRYEIDEAESVVTHIVTGASYPDAIGQRLKRYFTRDGNRLTIRTPPQSVAGVESVVTVVAEKIQ